MTRQRLAGPPPANVLEVVRDLGCLQLDPTSAVARSHLLVLWSRLGSYDPAELDRLLWEERRLFEYWAHAASLVLVEDYPLHALMMRTFACDGGVWERRVRAWVAANAAFRRSLLRQLTERGPLRTRDFEGDAAVPWETTGWTAGRNVSRMLDFLFGAGEVLVAGRRGGAKLWDLAERVLPADTPREVLPEREIVRWAAQRSLRALGVARPVEIARHFTRGRYPGLKGVLTELESAGRIVPVDVTGLDGPWLMHADDVPLLERLEAGEWKPRRTLLSPFDNLICDRERTERLFGFRFRLEIYVPKPKREYGFFVMPVLDGDRLVARVDPSFDRKTGALTVNAVHTEPGARPERAVAESVESLGMFLGAGEIRYPSAGGASGGRRDPKRTGPRA